MSGDYMGKEEQLIPDWLAQHFQVRIKKVSNEVDTDKYFVEWRRKFLGIWLWWAYYRPYGDKPEVHTKYSDALNAVKRLVRDERDSIGRQVKKTDYFDIK